MNRHSSRKTRKLLTALSKIGGKPDTLKKESVQEGLFALYAVIVLGLIGLVSGGSANLAWIVFLVIIVPALFGLMHYFSHRR